MDKMQTAKGILALKAGFWIALASKMQWKAAGAQCPGGVAATDGRTVWYNEENINARPMGEAVFIALHEIGHPMLCHLTRQGGRNKVIYGAAIDIVLNNLLAKIATDTPELKMVVPSDACVGSKFGLGESDITTVEAVYEKLLKKRKDQAKKNGKGKGEGGELDTSMFPGFDEHGVPKNADGTPVSASGIEALEREWKLTTQAAAIMAKQMGKLPGFLEEFIGELIKPKVDWRAQLVDCMSRIARDESSYRRFNRRHIARNTYLPGMYSERIGEIAYFCDTSGSISTDEFKAAMGAMTDILEDLKPEAIHFGQCDTKLHSVEKLTPDQLPLPGLKVAGRGGTDMAEAFEWACQHEHEIEAFILQTDGYIPDVPADLVPQVPVVWIVTTDAVLPCNFGTVVRVVL